MINQLDKLRVTADDDSCTMEMSSKNTAKRQKKKSEAATDRTSAATQDEWVKANKDFATWITDVNDERAKPFNDLKDGQTEGFFIAEGTETARMLLKNAFTQIISIFIKPNKFFEQPVHLLPDVTDAIAAGSKLKLLLSEEKIMSEIAGFHMARGCLAYGRIPTFDNNKILKSARRIIALDGVSDTANLGSVIRTASCLGVDVMILSKNSCDAWYRRAIRVSMGHCFRLPIIRVEDLAQTVSFLQDDCKVAAYASLVTEDCEVLDQIKKGTKPEQVILRSLTKQHRESGNIEDKWCCVLGNEGNGISQSVRSVCHHRVRINMDSDVDSLSLPVAAGILLHGLVAREQRL